MYKSKFIIQIGKTIYKIRTEKIFSLYKVAKAAKISTNHLKNIENGIVDCHFSVLLRVCAGLRVSVFEIFERARL